MERIEEPGDDEDVSFAPTPSPEEARARLAALRGKPLDVPSRLAVVEEERVEPEPAAPVAQAAAQQGEVSISLPADKMARLLDLLDGEAPNAERQKPAKADKALFKAKKVRITTRIDADVLEAFKATGPGWQTLMNNVLRQNMP